MRRSRGMRGLWRVFGAVLVALVLGGGPLAETSKASSVVSFSGKGNGYALGVTVDLSTLPAAVKAPIQNAYQKLRSALPAQLQSALPAQFDFVIDETFIETLAQMGVAQKAQALLGAGTVDLSKLLGGSDRAEASKAGQTSSVQTAAQQLPTKDLPIVDVAAGLLKATVSSGPNVSTDGVLSRLDATLNAVSALFPANLQGLFTQLEGAINNAIGTANSLLDNQLTTVASTISSTLTKNPVLGGLLTKAGLSGVASNPTQLAGALQSAVSIPTLAAGALTGTVASITDLHNAASTVKNSNGVATADASSSLASIDVLGLLHVDGVSLSSHSEAGGTPGSAKNSATCSLANVVVGGTNGVSVDGSHIYVNGTAIPTPLAQIDALKSTVDGILADAGISITTCDAAQRQAEADGTAAAQRVSALRIEIAPRAPVDLSALGIHAGDTLLRVVIDPTVETSVAAQVASPTTPTTKPNLPRTGAPAPLSVSAGLALAAGVVLLRRRFAH